MSQTEYVWVREPPPGMQYLSDYVTEEEAQELGVSRADMEGWRNDGLDAFRALSRSTVIELAGVPHDMIAVAAPRVAELVNQWLPQVR